MRPLLTTFIAIALALPAAAQGTYGTPVPAPVTQTPDVVYVPNPPPRPMNEVKTAPPSADAVWQPGYYAYQGNAWLWIPGGWAVPPAGKRSWVAARWAHADAGWYLVPGYWQ